MSAAVKSCRLIFEGSHKSMYLFESIIDSNQSLFAKVLLASICGSDLHTISGRRKEATPSVLGHEAVISLNDKRYTFSIFDSKCKSDNKKCSSCEFIKPKMPQKCEYLFKYGHSKVPKVIANVEEAFTGSYASHIAIRKGTEIFPIPSSISDELASTINCALATMISAMRKCPLASNGYGNAVILGDGLLGFYAGIILKETFGYRNIHMFGNSRSFRSDIIHKFGFFPHYSDEEAKKMLAGKVDVVVETAGNKRSLDGVYDIFRPGGFLILVGLVLPDSDIQMTAEQIIRKNLNIHGIHNYNGEDLKDAVDFMESVSASYPLDELMGPTFKLKDFEKAFDAANSKKYFRVFLKP